MQEENKGANNEGASNPPIAENSPNSEVVSKNETNTEEVKPQAEANSAPEPSKEDNLPFHQHPRFKELISEKNNLKNQLSQMERLMQEKFKAPQENPIDVARKKLTTLGVDEKAADEVLSAIKLVANSYTDSQVSPLKEATTQKEIDSWLSDFSKSHEDYEKLEPQMYEVFTALPPQTQSLIASDPMGVELLYDHVKQQNLKEELNNSYQKGVNDGYKNKLSKSSMTPGPAGSPNPPGDITRESIAKMSLAQYKERRGEVMAAMAKLSAEGEQSGVL